ncbi:MAG: MarR family transcriptional regulator [Paenibacillaceae bacterium]|nr:MarR family transcriptional regulator [Paenibacillaceae bacterium]
MEQQMREASGQRLEMLKRDKTGEKKLFEAVLWPVLKSFDGIRMEHELISITGVKIYLDTFISQFGIISECDGFVPHAELMTRERFMFERMRMRTIALYGYTYLPFSKDELDKQPEMCRRSLYEWIGRFGGGVGGGLAALSANERELLRFAIRANRPFRLRDAREYLLIGKIAIVNATKKLIAMKLLHPCGISPQRQHYYMADEQAYRFLK